MGQNFAETALLAIGSGLNSLGSILLAGWTDFQPESSNGELFYAFFIKTGFSSCLEAGWLAGLAAGWLAADLVMIFLHPYLAPAVNIEMGERGACWIEQNKIRLP